MLLSQKIWWIDFENINKMDNLIDLYIIINYN